MSMLTVANITITDGTVRVVTIGTTGTSGYSGYSGKSGYSGYSGMSGYSGANPGASGFSGYSGKSGFSGYSGSGFSGFSGAGASGFSGYSGISGFSGYSGKSGFSGYSGIAGFPLVITLSSGTLPANLTRYIGFGQSTLNATEANTRTVVGQSFTASDLYIQTVDNTTGDGTIVYTIRKNAGATAITITQSAAEAASTKSDTSHAASYVAGDFIDLEIVSNNSAVTPALAGFSIWLKCS